MEQNSPAEELPALYRAILDRVAELEPDGDRAEAARVRAAATRIYSRAWDERARRGLDGPAPASRPDRRPSEPVAASGTSRRRVARVTRVVARPLSPRPASRGRRLWRMSARRPIADLIDARPRRPTPTSRPSARRSRTSGPTSPTSRPPGATRLEAVAGARGSEAAAPGDRRRGRSGDRRDRPRSATRTARSTGCRPSRRSCCSRSASARREVPGRRPRRAGRRLRRASRPTRRRRARPRSSPTRHRPSACSRAP